MTPCAPRAGAARPTARCIPITALQLGTQVLRAVRDRNNLDTGLVDDVIFRLRRPRRRAGQQHRPLSVLNADYAETVAGVQINRFCASGLEAVNMASAQVMSGQSDMAIGGGVESMSRVGMGASGGSWPVDPELAMKTHFVPQGISADLIATMDGFSRDDVDSYAVEARSAPRAAGKRAGSRNPSSPSPTTTACPS
jgi:acetyl-CoA C-acetyltransferase